MTPTACLIDDKARVWDAGCASLRALCGLGVPIGDTAHFLVQTAGFIRVEIAKRAVHIAFNPHCVTPLAISGLTAFLDRYRSDNGPDVVFCLSVRDDIATPGRVVEIFGSSRQILNRLQFITREVGMPDDERFARRSLSIAEAARDRCLARFLETWRLENGAFNPDAVTPILRSELDGRYWLFERTPERRSYAIGEVGPALRIPDPHFSARLRGTDVNALPDTSCARWLSKTLDEVRRTGRPLYDEVSAHIFWPETGIVARRYRRLMVPWVNLSGRVIITSIIRPY